MKPGPADRRLAGLALCALLAVAAGVAAAADVEAGRALARQWCGGCHLVGPDGVGVDAAPPFPKMANDPAYTPTRIRGWLASPHPPMPDLHLTRTEIEAISSYLESLKDN